MKRLLVLALFLAATAPAHAARTILVFGDSISAGYGIDVGKGWVALLQAKLHREGYGYRVINASVSGETTAGGLARLPRALALHRPAVVILELGGNDGLRALPIEDMRANLAQMVRLAKAGGGKVLLLGMRIPPNYGPQYADQFWSSYGEVARRRKVPLVPFLLQGIALIPGSMQADGLHPNESAQPRVLANVWPALKPLLSR